GLDRAAVAWADFDGDTNLDFVVAGTSGNVKLTQVYKGDGNGGFTRMDNPSGLPTFAGLQNGAVAVGDLDPADGLMDFAVAGTPGSGPEELRVYRQLSAFRFSENNLDAYGVSDASLAFGDIDNDGQPDLAVMVSYG